jgi:hypothetical protein
MFKSMGTNECSIVSSLWDHVNGSALVGVKAYNHACCSEFPRGVCQLHGRDVHGIQFVPFMCDMRITVAKTEAHGFMVLERYAPLQALTGPMV